MNRTRQKASNPAWFLVLLAGLAIALASTRTGAKSVLAAKAKKGYVVTEKGIKIPANQVKPSPTEPTAISVGWGDGKTVVVPVMLAYYSSIDNLDVEGVAESKAATLNGQACLALEFSFPELASPPLVTIKDNQFGGKVSFRVYLQRFKGGKAVANPAVTMPVQPGDNDRPVLKKGLVPLNSWVPQEGNLRAFYVNRPAGTIWQLVDGNGPFKVVAAPRPAKANR